ncbi:hypothetical protein Golob_004685 [Gossypium lobatum]|uniref:Uncharacterized protein n=1 Tax=Gossypium lobatum TaxID=34289 RepID=A0A7J8N2H7_9ROSI|nr:hypothetical protein [Gossypium lobatum]
MLLALKTYCLLPFAEETVTILPKLIIVKDELIGSPSSAAKLWEALTRVLGTQTATKVMRSRSLLHFEKNTLSMSVYLAEIKHLCDLLVGCGHHISLEEQQSTILNGLPPKFDHVVLIITTS